MKWRQWVVLMLAAGTVLPAVAASKPEPRTLRDPHYGEVLFYFYQQKYFTALSRLMTAQHFGQFSHHADEAELLRGGMLLSYGVHRAAGEIFEKLISSGAAPAVRDRAWFYLAKIRYQRGYHEEAEQALVRIGDRLPRELEIERRLIQSYLLMRKEQFNEAVALLDGIQDEGGWTRYVRYNLGVALTRAGETGRGKTLLQQIGQLKAEDEEFKALRDKANVSLAYIALQGGRPDEARTALERVRLDGLMSNKALLGMGWAHSARDDQEAALVFWDELRQRPVQDSAVLEALLASPYALGKLGAFRKSLEQYEHAIAVFTREMQQLDESIVAIRSGSFHNFLLKDEVVEEMGWHWQLENLPSTPETRYLALLLASHEFQEALKNFRDLRFMSARLEQWVSDVESFQTMLATRRQGFRERLPTVLSSKRKQDLERLATQRDHIAARLQQIEADSDAEALAIEKEQAQLAKLERIRQLMSRAPADNDNRERYRLLRGLLRWDIETDYHARIWDASKQLRELDHELETSGRRRESLARAQTETPRVLDGFEMRISTLLPRIRTNQERTRTLVQAQAAVLAELAVAELDVQRERLANYLTQAQFAVAQIYDRSSAEPGKPPAPAPATGAAEPPPATEQAP